MMEAGERSRKCKGMGSEKRRGNCGREKEGRGFTGNREKGEGPPL